ncbi:acyl-CoA dehydrogenase family protein [Mycolicibacterium sp.]|uniref:acyl-CoA dehydrogenase family protein n=1 Tax=Mycolicibacterium sp. TaxID=2320850 RepID=UPI003D0D2C5E
MTTLTTVLAHGVFAGARPDDDLADLRQLIDEIGRRAAEFSVQRQRPQRHDDALWATLEETGLARLTSTPELGAGPAESAVTLYGLARHSAAVAIAETDLLAAWLADAVGLAVPAAGALAIAPAAGSLRDGRIAGTASAVAWPRSAAAVVLAVRTADGVWAGVVDAAALSIADGLNLAGEPRDRITFDLPADALRSVDPPVYDELLRRGAWARCIQVIGALDAAAASSVAHCRERVQFGRPLSKLQAVQQALAGMAGEIERGRAAATLAIAAAVDDGFGSDRADYAVSVAKVVLGAVVDAVTTTAHQLHGAIGVSIEHPLWLATLRAQSWIGEFGTTTHHAGRLGARALAADDPWDWVTGRV